MRRLLEVQHRRLTTDLTAWHNVTSSPARLCLHTTKQAIFTS